MPSSVVDFCSSATYGFLTYFIPVKIMENARDISLLINHVLNVNFVVFLEHDVKHCEVFCIHSAHTSGVPRLIIQQLVPIWHVVEGSKFLLDEANVRNSSFRSKQLKSDIIIKLIQFLLGIWSNDDCIFIRQACFLSRSENTSSKGLP